MVNDGNPVAEGPVGSSRIELKRSQVEANGVRDVTLSMRRGNKRK